MKKIFLLFTLLLLSNFLFADNKEIYLNLLKQNKYKELLDHLNNWEKAEPKSPEVFIGYFNYYIHTGSQSGLALESKPKGKEQLEIIDPKTGKTVGYFNDSTVYSYDSIKHAFEYINKGLEYNPKRLDMYFGKLYLLGEIKDFKTQGKVLIDVLNISISNKNKWLWSDDKPVDSGENFLLDNIQDYYIKWFDYQTDESLESIKNASLLEIKLYPKCIMGYNTLANYYSINKQYNDALKLLIDAEKIDSNDIIIINNLANCYKNLNKKEMAKKYYEKMIKIGDKDSIEYARKMLEKL